MAADKEIFKGMNLSDLFEEIYKNSKSTRKKIRDLVTNLEDSSYAATPHGAEAIVGYLEAGIKNDEHLIKLATVIQKIESADKKAASMEDFGLSDIEELLKEQAKLDEELQQKPSE